MAQCSGSRCQPRRAWWINKSLKLSVAAISVARAIRSCRRPRQLSFVVRRTVQARHGDKRTGRILLPKSGTRCASRSRPVKRSNALSRQWQSKAGHWWSSAAFVNPRVSFVQFPFRSFDRAVQVRPCCNCSRAFRRRTRGRAAGEMARAERPRSTCPTTVLSSSRACTLEEERRLSQMLLWGILPVIAAAVGVVAAWGARRTCVFVAPVSFFLF